jgi:alkylation response protein AidB-like acyl-CoA dehydrogenase
VDLKLTADHERYRQEVVGFLDEHWNGLNQCDRADPDQLRAFRDAATAAGLLYRSVPRRFGGSEQPADIVKLYVIHEEFARSRAPREVPGNGVNNLVPTLLERGEEWQRERFIPHTLTGKYLWCQGYSEPGAGSDLASLTTTARLDGDEWVINGQKIWTSFAAESSHMYVLVRTEPAQPRHLGLSYLLLEMSRPGIEVRPLRQMTGEMQFNEVFFDDVRTPADWVVGERGHGWSVSRSTLKHERNSLGSSARSEALFGSLVELARVVELHGRPAIEDSVVRDRLAALDARVSAQRWSGYLQLTRAAADRLPGRIGLTNKLMSTFIAHEIAAVAQIILGDHGLFAFEDGQRGPERWFGQIFGSLGFSIAGGTSNIQRNIVAERGLGLPRMGVAS